MIRLSCGDLDIINGSVELTLEENCLLWVVMMLMIIVACIIFLNFVICEASASYEKVSECLEEWICIDRCKLISEAESMAPYILRKEDHYPKYIV